MVSEQILPSSFVLLIQFAEEKVQCNILSLLSSEQQQAGIMTRCDRHIVATLYNLNPKVRTARFGETSE